PSFLARCHDPGTPPATNAADATADADASDAGLASDAGDASVDADASARDASARWHVVREAAVSTADLRPFTRLPKRVSCGTTTCGKGEKCCLRGHATGRGTESGAPA